MTTPAITLVSYSFAEGAGGIETCSRLFARVLVRQARALGYECELVATRPSADQDREIEGHPIIRTDGSRRRLWSVLTRRSAASPIIFAHVNLARIAAIVPRRRPYAIILHGIEIWEPPSPALRRACTRADRLVVVSEFSRSKAEGTWAGYGRATVCWLGTEDDETAARNAPSGHSVLMVGRLEPNRDKGHRAMIAAWPDVLSRVPHARLVIVGGGNDLAAIRRLAGATPNVDVRGRVAQTELDALWSEARVFALPSHGEGFGLVYVDAMRRGIPVVVSTRDSGREVVGDDVAGIATTPDGLADAVSALLLDDELHRRHGDAGRDRWARHFAFAAFETRLVELLGSAWNRSKRR